MSRFNDNKVSRRTVLRNAALTSATAVGLSTVPSSVAAETLDGDRNESYGHGDVVDVPKDADCTTCELGIGSALDEDSAPYDDGPAPVHCNWVTQIAGSAGRTVIDNLEMTVEIINKDDGWNFSNASKSKRKAPSTVGFEPSFGVSIGWMIYEFNLNFSSSGTENEFTHGDEIASWNFGSVCDSEYGHSENAGWIRVQLTNPKHSNPSGACKLKVTTTADATYIAGGAGPCGTNANGESRTMKAEETFTVDFV